MNLIDFNNKTIRIFTYFLLIIGSALILLPFLWLISTSFKDPVHIYQMPPDWIPDNPNFNNYQRIFGEFNFLRYLWNSLWLSIVNIIGNIISCSMTAYAFASSRFKYKKQLFIVLLATMMIPGEVVFFPQFILFNFLGWYGSMKPLFVPAFLGNAFFIFLLRQYFLTIPKELVDAARIDGCSEWRIFRKIYLPLSKPALATVAIYTFMAVWNDFFTPLIYITREENRTASVALYYLKNTYESTSSIPITMAASFISIIPCVLIYYFGQKFFVHGIVYKGVDK